jgi:xanthine dehydrogenase large subunit
VQFADGRVFVDGGESLAFVELVQLGYLHRVQLWSDGFYKTPGLSWDPATLTGNPFYYFAYGAAVSEVVIDTLTGEWKLLRADLLHDTGRSLNPAIDKGQIEGGFVQGAGWLTTEELCWNERGLLTTHAPSTYKIPAVNDAALDLRTVLFDRDNHAETVLRSKAVGEPPLLLGFSVYLAIRDAIASARADSNGGLRHAPASCEKILAALDDGD